MRRIYLLIVRTVLVVMALTSWPAAQAAQAAGPSAPAPDAKSVIGGRVLLDEDGDGRASLGDRPLIGVPARIVGPGLDRQLATSESGAFNFGELPSGAYTVSVGVPSGVVSANGTARVLAVDGRYVGQIDFFVVRPARVPTFNASINPSSQIGNPTPPAAPRVLPRPAPAPGFRPPLGGLSVVRGESTLWLGIPFLTQLDGTAYALVNCGPASVAMVLNAYGVQQSPAEIRDKVNVITGVYGRGVGTSLDSLAHVVQEAGLEVFQLYDGGGYLRWNTDLLRAEVAAGRPVITLTKYRLLPGLAGSRASFDHYIVITGLAGDGFIYNDAAFSSEMGAGLVISAGELDQAWDYSSIPRHAMSVGFPTAS